VEARLKARELLAATRKGIEECAGALETGYVEELHRRYML
jgi:hypothetical protein